jgi:hypothetical protein
MVAQLQVAFVQGIDHRSGLGIHRREVGFVGKRIGPLGALVNPALDRRDLFVAERTGWGHLHAKRIPRYTVKQKAVFAAAWHYAAAAQDDASPVETHAAALLRWTMTGHAVLPQDREDVLSEIHLRRSLARHHPNSGE